MRLFHHQVVYAALLACLIPQGLAAQTPVPARAWMGTLTLPTYEEGPPDLNPAFDAFLPAGRPNYPYTTRDQLTNRRREKAWRALYVENEFLKCAVLPDVGGHLYSCTDKVNGQEMFYANTALKFSNIAYRGSWAAFGIEFNFPVSHNWMTTSPVDFALRNTPDGSATIVVGNVDRPYGMQWTVELTLRPGRAALEQHTMLYNRSAVRRRFYWWTNAAVRAFDDTQILYPMTYTASHGFADIDRWPVDARGTDNSVLKHHIYGPVSRFSHGSREGYMAIWQPRTNAGVAHYAAPEELPAKKIWSWGVDVDAMDWRRQLSDDSSAYVEIQAGLFRDQETYAFLEPQGSVAFTEHWLPLRTLGGVTRVTPEAALFMERTPSGTDSVLLRIALNTVSRSAHASIAIDQGQGRAFVTSETDLDPAQTWSTTLRLPASAPPVRVTVRDGRGAELIAHREGAFDYLPDSLIRTGPQPKRIDVSPDRRTEGDWMSRGAERDVNGDALGALADYRMGLALFPTPQALTRAAARILVSLGLFAEGEEMASRALSRESADHEMAYYRGLARMALGDTLRARRDFEIALQYGAWRSASLIALTRLDMSQHRERLAWERLRSAPTDRRASTQLAELYAVVSNAANISSAKTSSADSALAANPIGNVVRWHRRTLQLSDDSLLVHLGGDAERVLDIADEYLLLGLYSEAIALLSTAFPDSLSVVHETGVPTAGHHPLVAYYRGYAKEMNGADGAGDYADGAKMSLRYVFPHRPVTRQVLEHVVRQRPSDAGARYLLGMLAMQRGEVVTAIAMWDSVRATRPEIPALHRNLGYALLLAGDTARARDIFSAGIEREPGNAGVWIGLDSLLAITKRPAAERASTLDRFPDRLGMPTALVYRYARLLSQAGRFDDAERLFAGRFFSRVEGGTNPRGVWLEVRSARALALAVSGQCTSALKLMGGLTRPVAALPFTRDGLVPLLSKGEVGRRLDDVRRRCSAR